MLEANFGGGLSKLVVFIQHSFCTCKFFFFEVYPCVCARVCICLCQRRCVSSDIHLPHSPHYGKKKNKKTAMVKTP